MPPRLPTQACHQVLTLTSPQYLRSVWAPFSASTKKHVDNLSQNPLFDLLENSRPSRPQQDSTPPRARSAPLSPSSTSSILPDIPAPGPLPRRNRPGGAAQFEWQDSARPARINPRRPPPPAAFGAESQAGSSIVNLMSQLSPKGQQSLRKEEARQTQGAQTRQIENQAARTWRNGDIYAPHDLSPAEMHKARQAKYGRTPNLPVLNSRKKGGRDLIDDLGIDPLREYKNFALMGEFVSELGRIKHSRETGLRAVNQRKMAKAIRRAIGIGIMPSVHRHPELMEKRAALRPWARNKMRTPGAM